jgi:hypothetical protein
MQCRVGILCRTRKCIGGGLHVATRCPKKCIGGGLHVVARCLHHASTHKLGESEIMVLASRFSRVNTFYGKLRLARVNKFYQKVRLSTFLKQMLGYW